MKKKLYFILILLGKVLYFNLLTIVLLPFSIPFILLYPVSPSFFWDKIWSGIIMGKIDSLNLIPKF